MAWGAFWGTRALEIVKKHDSGGLVWKRIKLTTTRKANAKKRLRRVWQLESFQLYRNLLVPSHLKSNSAAKNEAVLRACSEQPPSRSSSVDSGDSGVESTR